MRRPQRSTEVEEDASSRGAARNEELKAETEALLDEIDELLDGDAEERRRYAAMLKGWAARQERLDSACHGDGKCATCPFRR